MSQVLCLLAILGAVVGGPISDDLLKQSLKPDLVGVRNSALEQLVLNLAEDLRDVIKHGSDGVPVLDPFELDHLELKGDDIGLEGSHLAVTDLVVNHLSTFVFHDLSISLEGLLPPRYRVRFVIGIPILELDTGAYDIFGAFAGYELFGAGKAKLQVIEPRITGNLLIRTSILGLSLSITECEINFNLQGFEPQLTGLYSDDAASTIVSLFLRNFVPELLIFYEPEVTQFLSDTVMEIGNNFLDDFDLSSILG